MAYRCGDECTPLADVDSQNICYDGTTTTLKDYLTSQNPRLSAVRESYTDFRHPNCQCFWWDVRQIVPWKSFSITTIINTTDFLRLLDIPILASELDKPPRISCSPETEAGLHEIHTNFYAVKLNSALRLSLGIHTLTMHSTCLSGNSMEPSFYSDCLCDGLQFPYRNGRGRVVGIVTCSKRWNTSKRSGLEPRKVEYLQGLSRLYWYMRERACRYGFIITEFELVVVRNGVEDIPHFGYLEIQTIQLSTSTSSSDGEDLNNYDRRPKMTALLALWYLHMLAKDDVLPGQVGWKIEVGNPKYTSIKGLPKEEWMPKLLIYERRMANRTRGWIWPDGKRRRKKNVRGPGSVHLSKQ
ncbi:hypothetical protein F5884DRAFT_808897 [Xylogone sp. PMI_703]|nr:hypothetical protein F5884DRAFT_808897 [Xylogone sp. PMI_703]